MGWIATLNNGEIIQENTPGWDIIPGERTPWARLCQYCVDNKLIIDKLTYGNITLPYAVHQFQLQGLAPNNYSISRILEIENLFSGNDASEYIDLCSHYDSVDIHFITDGIKTWVQVTDPGQPLVPSPNRKG